MHIRTFEGHLGRGFRVGTLVLSSVLLAGCATLPSNGPTANQVVSEIKGKNNVLGIQIIDIDPSSLLTTVAERPRMGPTFGSLASEGPVDRVGPGDILSVQIYEVGVSLFGRNFMPSDDGLMPAPTAGGQQIGSGFTVADDGTISLPYIGRLQVAGLTPSQVEAAIVRGLRGKSQSPQAVVTVRQNVANTVTIVGGVPRPGRQGLTPARARLLDAIVDAGGVSTQDTIIRFTRQGRTIEQPLELIDPDSADNLTLLPNDRIEVIRQPRTFLVFGATDRISQVPFETRTVSLAEAMARVGGPSDARADPRSVFVFRFADGLPVPGPDTTPESTIGQRPIVYRLDMTRASSYFLAQKFAMRDKDIIYVSNSSTNQRLKLAQIINILTQPIFTIWALTQ